MQILPARSRRDRKRFLGLPARIYQGDPLWAPALAAEEKALVGFKKHPFHAVNDAQCFLAVRGDEAVGRIAAIHNREHNAQHQDRTGFFGFFECQDDAEAAAALFAAASGWLAERGLDRIRGPANPSINYTLGTLVEGHDVPPTFMTPYNPPYYAGLIEGAGFQKEHDLWALRMTMPQMETMASRVERITQRLTKQYGLKLRTWSATPRPEELREFLGVINSSLQDHWGFVPLTQKELQRAAAGLRLLLVPELVIGIEIEGRLVGVTLALPDYNPRIKKIGGRLFPFGFLQLLARKRSIKKHRVMAANVLPEYNRAGLGVVLIHALILRARELGCQEVEYSWIAESNAASFGTLENAGAHRCRTFRVWEQFIAY
ncbi:GNAT family N-acetyltransferase [Pirellulimonas nuda]|uniref:GNAT family N-acetyltransferase n=1 Tax=Pirellulimonas nuda TaxID=2528009 RepID=UPI0011AB14BF|nr:GNAT family N-acetyltransferase [Pirellulimonas nuda]